MGWQPHAARNQALRFRQHSIELMQSLAPHMGDTNKLASLAKQGRQHLEEQWSRERAQRRQAQTRRGEGFSNPKPPAGD